MTGIPTPFLEKTAKHLYEKYGDKVSDLCIVLPNRRGGLFFRKYLARLLSKPIWTPQVFSSEDFVAHLSGLQLVDNTDLFFHLYEIHRKIKGSEAESFGDFSRWAHILINDFNEVDQYLAKADVLYKNLKQVKEIENWSLGEEELTEFQHQYLRFWDTLGIYYRELKEKLLSLKQAYPGLAYRRVAEDVDNKFADISWTKIIFAGFNAMNKAEEEIISSLLKLGKAELLWDTDSYYMNNKVQEAGKFLRRYRDRFSVPSENSKGKEISKSVFNWEENNLSSTPKKITIIGTPGNVAQASVSGSLVNELIEQGHPADEIALVLADESLLFPVLNSLPAPVKEVNVTMGYPLRNTPVSGFVNALFGMQENVKNSGDSTVYYHRDIQKILSHPFTHTLLGENAGKAIELSGLVRFKNYIYVTKKELLNLAAQCGLEDTVMLQQVFSVWQNPQDALDKQLLLFEQLAYTFPGNQTEDEKNEKNRVEEEYISAASRILKRVKELSLSYDYLDSIKTLSVLVKQMIRGVSLPFYGEPLAGLQVMGMLETRTLDFKNVILLSANENILPSPRTQNTFIPFDIKKAYGLPVYNDKDAVFAYHFYRLLQGAETIYLLYNTEQDLFGRGEKSRFITQLIHELPRVSPAVQIEEKFLSTPLKSIGEEIVISIEKSKQVMDKLVEKARSGFSPTALNSYINCSLQFYFKAVAGLQETEEVEETIGADVLGTVVHAVLQDMFSPFTGKIIGEEDVKQMKAQTEGLLRKSLEEFFSKNELKYGKNLLVFRAACQLIGTFLDNEMKWLKKENTNGQTVRIEGLEMPLQVEMDVKGEKIVLKGTADRIDRVGNSLRIIDYKTGKVDNAEIHPESLEEVLSDRRYNKSFQLLMYAWMYARQYKISAPLQAGIITFRELSSGLKMLKIDKKNDIGKSVLDPFEALTRNLLLSVFDPLKPFTQTSDRETCLYCSFKKICNR